MKKIYATILTAMLGCSAMMAQSDSDYTFAFTFDGEVVPNGATVTVANYVDEGYGIYELSAPVNIKNVTEDACQLTLTCTGIDNYCDVAFCPNDNCQPWNGTTISTTYSKPLEGGAMAESGNWLHVTVFDVPEFQGTIELRAMSSMDPDDCVSLTVRFDTKGQQGVQSLKSLKAATSVEVYNLCGRKVANTTAGLAKGVYIIKQGKTSRKVVIK